MVNPSLDMVNPNLAWVSGRPKLNAEYGLTSVNEFFKGRSHQVRPATNAGAFGQLNITAS